MAFVSSFTPALISSPLTPGNVCKAVSKSTARFSMSEKSASVPFMEAPTSLSSDLPGYAGFDPLNISAYVDIKFLQEAEIKHGRICMLAILGLMVAELYSFPFYAGAPHLVVDRHDWAVKNGALTQVLLWCSFFEVMTMPAFVQMTNGTLDRLPGDYMFDPLGLGKDVKKMASYKVNEIKNGRLAMVAVSGAIHHAIITKQNLFEQLISFNVLPQ